MFNQNKDKVIVKLTFATSIIGILTACIIHSTSFGVYPPTSADTSPTYVARNIVAFTGAPP